MDRSPEQIAASFPDLNEDQREQLAALGDYAADFTGHFDPAGFVAELARPRQPIPVNAKFFNNGATLEWPGGIRHSHYVKSDRLLDQDRFMAFAAVLVELTMHVLNNPSSAFAVKELIENLTPDTNPTLIRPFINRISVWWDNDLHVTAGKLILRTSQRRVYANPKLQVAATLEDGRMFTKPHLVE